MYAVFTQRKVSVVTNLDNKQQNELNLDNQQFKLVDDSQLQQAKLAQTRNTYAEVLATLYQLQAQAANGPVTYNGTSYTKDQMSAMIAAITQQRDASEAEINDIITKISQKESTIEQLKDRLETSITKLEKELENIEKAESSGIDRSNPKYDGLG